MKVRTRGCHLILDPCQYISLDGVPKNVHERLVIETELDAMHVSRQLSRTSGELLFVQLGSDFGCVLDRNPRLRPEGCLYWLAIRVSHNRVYILLLRQAHCPPR